jgi:cytochrome c oxidase subunit 2
MPDWDAGQILVQRNACLTCHSLDGSRMIGPSFKGIWGREEEMQDGQKITVDANYIRESILQPMAKVVKGYAPAMPPYQGTFNEEELGAIIEYLKDPLKK